MRKHELPLTHSLPYTQAMKEKTILYSHGFGTRADARGIFTDISSVFPEREHVFFDYNDLIDEKTIRATPIGVQERKFTQQYEAIDKSSFPIDIISHSLGCVIAAKCMPIGVRKAVFLAPPPLLDVGFSLMRLQLQYGITLDQHTESRLTRRDGHSTLIPPAYWEGLDGVDPISLYNAFAQTTEMHFICANQDEAFRMNTFPGLDKSILIHHIDGDHNFIKEYRAGLLATIAEILS